MADYGSAQLLARAKEIRQEFRQITMPLMRKRLLEHKTEVAFGRISTEVPLTKRQVACCLTDLSASERRIVSLADIASGLSGNDLAQSVQLMENEVRAAESLSPSQMMERSKFAGLFELLSLYQIPKKATELAEYFSSHIIGPGKSLVLRPEERSSGIYLLGKEPMQMAGTLSHLEVEVPEVYLSSPTTRLTYPMVGVDYDWGTQSFVLQSLSIKLESSGQGSWRPPAKIMDGMFAAAGLQLTVLLDSMAGAIQHIGASAAEVENAANDPTTYSFSCRTPDHRDPAPSNQNGYREMLLEASIRAKHPSSETTYVEGKITMPDRQASIAVSYGCSSPRDVYVFDEKANSFKLRE